MSKTFKTRIVHKHDIEANWTKAINFIPKQGEMIVYDVDDTHSYQRLKIGDGIHTASALAFYGANILDQLNIDYDNEIAFDTSEIIFNTSNTSILGQAILGQMVLA